jgi:hypothetical protein
MTMHDNDVYCENDLVRKIHGCNSDSKGSLMRASEARLARKTRPAKRFEG